MLAIAAELWASFIFSRGKHAFISLFYFNRHETDTQKKIHQFLSVFYSIVTKRYVRGWRSNLVRPQLIGGDFFVSPEENIANHTGVKIASCDGDDDDLYTIST